MRCRFWRSKPASEHRKKKSFLQQLREFDKASLNVTYDDILEKHGGNRQAADLVWQDYLADRKGFKPSWLFLYMMDINNKQEAGYHYEPDDLSEEEWILLSEFKSSLRQYQVEQLKK